MNVHGGRIKPPCADITAFILHKPIYAYIGQNIMDVFGCLAHTCGAETALAAHCA